MIKKVEHIGFAVKNLATASALFENLLNRGSYKKETIQDEEVITSFYNVGDTKIELLEPINNSGPIGDFLKKKGEGMHHIAFEVDDIDSEIQRLKKCGFKFVNSIKKKGADNKWICFLHPKSTNGVLIELCQEIK